MSKRRFSRKVGGMTALDAFEQHVMPEPHMKGRQAQGAKNHHYRHGRYVGDKQNPIYHAHE